VVAAVAGGGILLVVQGREGECRDRGAEVLLVAGSYR
jgi:hypothetical protein